MSKPEKKFTARKPAAPKPAVKKETSTFSAFDKVKVDIKTSLYDEENLIEKLIHQDVSVWIPLLLIAKDNERALKFTTRFYSEDFVAECNEFFKGGVYCAELLGIPIPSLCKAISRITSNIVYSNDGGKAYVAFDGLGILEGTAWTVPIAPKNLNVVRINSEQAVDSQLFCASVAIDAKVSTVLVGEVHQNISVPYFKKKNCPDKDRIPLKIKALFPCLLKNVNWDDYTMDDIKTAPWIWEYVAEAARNVKLPTTGIPLELAYFAFVKQSYDYCPSPLNSVDIIYGNYPRINKDILSQLNQHSFMVGGKCVKPGHFFNVGIGICENRHFGGLVPAEYCRYNTYSKVTWERAGAYVESTLLGTTVNTIRDIKDFDGIWYDPWVVNQAHLKNASGLIIPYDKKGNGIAALEAWINLNGINPKGLNLWATFGSQPLLWVEKRKHPRGYSHVAAAALWKCMPVVNLYNFCCSLNRNCALANASGDFANLELECAALNAEGVPTDPMAALEFSGRANGIVMNGKKMTVPEFEFHFFKQNFLPGRHLQKEKKIEEADAAREDFDLYHDFAKEMADADPTAHEDFIRRPPKKAKTDMPDEHMKGGDF